MRCAGSNCHCWRGQGSCSDPARATYRASAGLRPASFGAITTDVLGRATHRPPRRASPESQDGTRARFQASRIAPRRRTPDPPFRGGPTRPSAPRRPPVAPSASREGPRVPGHLPRSGSVVPVPDRLGRRYAQPGSRSLYDEGRAHASFARLADGAGRIRCDGGLERLSSTSDQGWAVAGHASTDLPPTAPQVLGESCEQTL